MRRAAALKQTDPRARDTEGLRGLTTIFFFVLTVIATCGEVDVVRRCVCMYAAVRACGCGWVREQYARTPEGIHLARKQMSVCGWC